MNNELKLNNDPAKVAAGHKGGLKGGPARAEALSADERSKIAKEGAAARWNSDKLKYNGGKK